MEIKCYGICSEKCGAYKDGRCSIHATKAEEPTEEERQTMKVNICGIKHEVIECDDAFNADASHFGQIDYLKCKIHINKDMHEDMKKQTICHEMVHGILVHLGYQEQSTDEQFVQALANGIMQGFTIKEF